MFPLVTIDYTDLGRKLQQRRRHLGLTQDQISHQLSISTTQLSRIECGQRPSLQTLIQLTALLNLSLDNLFNVYTSTDRTSIAIHQCLMDLTDEQRLELLHFLNCLTHKIHPLT